MTPAEARVRWKWTYVNRGTAPVDLWVALPPELPGQRDVRVVEDEPAGFTARPSFHGPNRVAFITLPAGAGARLTIQAVLVGGADAEEAGQAGGPSGCLGSNPLITVSDEARAEAVRVTAGIASPVGKARRLYRLLLDTCHYEWPPAERGSESMRRNRRGDCGEYAFLYAAWCRSVGLPCRVLFGALVGRRMRGHAWNEVFVDGPGWLVVDSLPRELLLARLAARGVRWAPRLLDRSFAWRRPDRLAFSVDPLVPLRPPFRDRTIPDGARAMVVGGRPFAWGFETYDGKAPYLQPCYVRFTANVIPAASTDYLGRWSLERF